MALPSATAKQVVVGSQHSCALTTEGGVRCWGYQEHGELGNGAPFATTNANVPVQVTGLESGVKMIATYDKHTCAITAAGGVMCWGLDENGQLGTGIPRTDNGVPASNVPVAVMGLSSGVTAIAVGLDSACAIVAEGKVKCWGHDESGKLGNSSTHTPGDGSPAFQPPVDVTGLSGAVQVSVGFSHACAVLATGALKCWGSNASGELGIGTDDPPHTAPVDVVALGTNVASVVAGFNITCAILKTGALQCWGHGDDGALGDGMTGTIRVVSSPTQVLGATTGVTSVSNTGIFTCAVISGATKCWGNSGALGTANGPSYRNSAPGEEVVGLGTGSAAVATGNEFACALTSAGGVKCWGQNGVGELGDGKGGIQSNESSDTPVNVVSLP